MKTSHKILLAIILASLALLLDHSVCHAETKYNVFLMGDSIIDNHPHKAKGLAQYMPVDESFTVVCDYSYAGTKICKSMPGQTTKLTAQLEQHPGEKNVIIYSFGTNDYFKNCRGKHLTNIKNNIQRIKDTDENAIIICITPTHIWRVHKTTKFKKTLYYTINDDYLKSNVITLRTSTYIRSSDIKSDCIHLKASGYKKTVIQIKKMLNQLEQEEQ